MSPIDAIEMLAEQVSEKQCVLFLGNDLPLGFPGSAPPCRDELAAALAGDLDHELSSEGNLARVALLYEVRRDRNALIQRVRELVDNPDYRPTALHHQVAALPFRAILTTAQDRLLERALQAAGRAYAADVTGAAAGALLTGALLIPIIGFALTAASAFLLATGTALLARERC